MKLVKPEPVMALWGIFGVVMTVFALSGNVADAHPQGAPSDPKVNQVATKVGAKDPKVLTAADYWQPWDAWLKHHGSPISGQDVFAAAQETKIKGEVLICITYAETNMGKVKQRGSGTNVGSVGSYDHTNTTYAAGSIRHGLVLIGQTLNNNLLGKKVTIAQLSRKSEPYGPVYAESRENWERNVLTCLSQITGQPQNNQFKFRLEQPYPAS